MIELRLNVAPDQLSLVELIHRCQEEAHLYMQHLPTSNTHCLELFRRAIEVNDQLAWSALYELYENLVGSWILRAKANTTHLHTEDVASLLNETFAKFYRGMRKSSLSKFQYSLPALLKYLKLCARSVVIDENRLHQTYAYEASLDEADEQDAIVEDFSQNIANALAAQQLWRVVLEQTRTEQERVFLVLTYHLNMKPNDIQHHYSHLFTTIESVYSVRRNIMERLRRNHLLHMTCTQIFQGEEFNEA